MEEKLIELIKTSKSRNEVLLNYFGKNNGESYELLNDFINKNKIDVTHLEKETKYCLNCGKKIEKWGKKFCGNSCSASYTNKGKTHSIETRLKISSN